MSDQADKPTPQHHSRAQLWTAGTLLLAGGFVGYFLPHPSRDSARNVTPASAEALAETLKQYPDPQLLGRYQFFSAGTVPLRGDTITGEVVLAKPVHPSERTAFNPDTYLEAKP